MVLATGIEPAREFPLDPKSSASASSATRALNTLVNYIYLFLNMKEVFLVASVCSTIPIRQRNMFKHEPGIV